jgi:putative ATPase
VNSALLSRSQVYVLKSFDESELRQLVDRAREGADQLEFDEAAIDTLIGYADGDGRRLLNLLEVTGTAANAAKTNKITTEFIQNALTLNARRFDKGGDNFYDQISALHKSVRGSNPDAALYWLCRMLDGGADALPVAPHRAHGVGRHRPGRPARHADRQRRGHHLRAPRFAGRRAGAGAGRDLPGHRGQEQRRLQRLQRSDGLCAQGQVARSAGPPAQRADQADEELGYGHEYRYAHDEPHAYAAGETYFPDDMREPGWYQPVPRGLEPRSPTRWLSCANWTKTPAKSESECCKIEHSR